MLAVWPKLPNAPSAIVQERKIFEYLLSDTHPDGRTKAQFFAGFGYSLTEWQTLANALRQHARENPLVEAVETVFGTRYVVEGVLHAPDGRRPKVRTVWFTDSNNDVPRLVTAYPVKRR